MASLDRSLSKEGLSLYQTLGLEKTATDSEIKKAYHKKALRCHPDKHPNDPTKAEEFQKINKASSILRDERKRKIYDKLGSQGLQIIDSAGIEVAEAFVKYDSIWYKVGFMFCFLITGCGCGCCCCCCLCCCCCGKLRPPKEEDEQELNNKFDENEVPSDDDQDRTTTNSPDHNPSSTTQQPTTIPLGPVTGQPTSNPETNSNATPTVFAMPPPEYTAT